MKRFLASLIWGIAALGAASDKPNIVFILVDDTGWNALEVLADPLIPGSRSSYYKTPHTSKLAREGVRFSMAYSPAPTCGPSRTSIQYGQSPSTLGKFAEKPPSNLPSADDALVRRLKAAHPEYRAAHFGKWHQRTRTPEDIGYDESDGQTFNQEGNEGPADDPKLSFNLADKTNNFMARQSEEGNPFFVQVSFYANHLTYKARPETIRKFEGQSGEATQYHNSPLWAAMHEEMDDAVGSIVQTIEELGIRENTYIIYTADNGYESKVDSGVPVDKRTFHKAHPLLSHKYMISEGGLRVPFFVTGPGIAPGISSREPVVGWDIMPTVLDMADAATQIPDHVEGGSLLPLLTHEGTGRVERRDDFLVFRYTKRMGALDIAIVQDGYKLLRELRSGEEHLWDLWGDLSEQNNLLTEMPEKSAQLRGNLDGYFERLKWDQTEHFNYKKQAQKKK